jgi:pimeloyl-ACP methyl ester carboxylesterase
VEAILGRWSAARPHDHPGVRTLVMRVISQGERALHCELDLPPGMTRGSGPYPAVIFAHDRDSNGRSPHTVPISRRLAKRHVIGVRLDFTGHGQSEGRPQHATDECLLADLRAVMENVRILQEVDPRRIGLNGAGSAGRAVLRFASAEPTVAALVIRGPLAGGEIEGARQVRAPTLLIHGEHDPEIARLDLLDPPVVIDPTAGSDPVTAMMSAMDWSSVNARCLRQPALEPSSVGRDTRNRLRVVHHDAAIVRAASAGTVLRGAARAAVPQRRRALCAASRHVAGPGVMSGTIPAIAVHVEAVVAVKAATGLVKP